MQARATKRSILDAANRIEEIRKKFLATKNKKMLYPCDEIDQLSFPGGLASAITALRNKDPLAIKNGILFLEVDPFFFRSGYIKERVIRALKKVSLSIAQKKKLQQIIIDSLSKKYRREFKEYCRLAPIVADHDFVEQLEHAYNGMQQPVKKQYIHALLTNIKQRLKQ